MAVNTLLNGCALVCQISCIISVNSFLVQMELYQSGRVSFYFCVFQMCDLLMGTNADHNNSILPGKIRWVSARFAPRRRRACGLCWVPLQAHESVSDL